MRDSRRELNNARLITCWEVRCKRELVLEGFARRLHASQSVLIDPVEVESEFLEVENRNGLPKKV